MQQRNIPWCPRCKWATPHTNRDGILICTKCWDRNAMTIQRAILIRDLHLKK